MSPLEAERGSADALPRMHALLVEAVRRRRGIDPHQVPVTVAEIYQDLVPYRTARAVLGVEMNADYEYLLLRLLSGEQELARLEPGAAREQIAHELDSPNPNVTLYRKFAACDVWLMPSASTATPAWLSEHLGDEVPAEEAEAEFEEYEPEPVEAAIEPEEAQAEEEWQEESEPAPRPVRAPARARVARTFTVAEDVPPAAEPEPEPPAAPAPAPARPPAASPPLPHCAFCDSALPSGRAARYCPYCGADQKQRPCSSCGEPVEAGWAFCIACGTQADAGSA